MSPQLGSISVAPLWPQTAQRNESRSRSLEASAPQRMIQGVSGVAVLRQQPAPLQ